MNDVLPRSVYWLGLDLGLRRNPSALALLEEETRAAGFDRANWVPVTEKVLVLKDVRPLRLETPYAEIPGLIHRYLRLLKPGFPVHLTVDASGVGAPVVELLQRAKLGVELHPVVITSGESVGKLPHAVTVPRWVLLENVRIRLECKDLKIAKGLAHEAALREELASLGVQSNHSDDLAMALALALWRARPRPNVGERAEILPGAPVGDNWKQRAVAELLWGHFRR